MFFLLAEKFVNSTNEQEIKIYIGTISMTNECVHIYKVVIFTLSFRAIGAAR